MTKLSARDLDLSTGDDFDEVLPRTVRRVRASDDLPVKQLGDFGGYSTWKIDGEIYVADRKAGAPQVRAAYRRGNLRLKSEIEPALADRMDLAEVVSILFESEAR